MAAPAPLPAVRRIPKARLAAAFAATVLTLSACSNGSEQTGAAVPAAAPGHDAAAMPSPTGTVPTQPLRAGERFVDLTAPASYTPTAPNGGTDEYRCLLLDPKLATSTFLTGTQFEPQNVLIVHHAIVFAVPPASAAAARAKDAAAPGQGWTCFSNDTLGGGHQTSWVGTWTPNGTETVLPRDVGFALAPGSLIILQIHYNLLAVHGSTGGSDQSGVRLRLSDGTSSTKPLEIMPLQAPIELPCATGESGPLCDRAAAIADVGQRFGSRVGAEADRLLRECGYTKPRPGNSQYCDIPVEEAMTVYAALGHMHLLGRSIKVELNPGTAHARTLLDVPSFNFDDQKFQVLPSPVDVGPGDKLRVTCTHDATLRALLPQLADSPPRYVVWGDGTSDEMCLGLLMLSARA